MPASSQDSRHRVFVVEDHPLMRKSIVAAFEREQDLAVCGEADDSRDAFAGIVASQPDVVVTDLALKESSGLDLINALRERAPALPVVATTMFNVLTSERLARAAGAAGFVSKQEGPEFLVRAVHAALQACTAPVWRTVPEAGSTAAS